MAALAEAEGLAAVWLHPSLLTICMCADVPIAKTSGLVIPALLEWDGPVIATSVRTDLVDATAAARSTRGGHVVV